jgi:hypothetical protein
MIFNRKRITYVGIADVTGLSHVIFEILPTASWRKSGYQNAVFGTTAATAISAGNVKSKEKLQNYLAKTGLHYL